MFIITTGSSHSAVNPITSSLICLSNLDLQIAHGVGYIVVFPFHVRLTCPVQGHLESTEKLSQREIQFRIRQAVSEHSVSHCAQSGYYVSEK